MARSESGMDQNPGPRLSRRRLLASGAALAGAPLWTRMAQAAPETPRTFQAPSATPARPWAGAARRNLPPGEPGKDYTPSFTPGGSTLEYKVVDGVKVYHLVAEPIRHEVVRGLVIDTWGYNGTTPGPTIEATAGDRVRIYVTNNLPAPTSVHWHGILLPSGMDGVTGLNQPPIQPGETFKYEFIFPDAGTFMYHPHFDGMTQEGLGMTGMIVVHERLPRGERPDRDFVLMLHEWFIEPGTSRPFPVENTDFNVLTINGKAFPDTTPLVAELGDRVRIRIGNLSAMDHHPIHLHGYTFEVVETDGGQVPPSARWPETTVLVHVGATRAVEFLADNPGDWLMHCHMTHHTMLQMGHDVPNMLGVDTEGLEEKIRKLLPEYMTMGTTGMMALQKMGMPVPDNSVPMLGFRGQFGQTILGSMVTTLKVRDRAEGYDDPGPYDFPEGTVPGAASEAELRRDGIVIPKRPETPRLDSMDEHEGHRPSA